jgi:hypothetical protein
VPSQVFTTAQCLMMKYSRQLMQAILCDKIQIAKAVNVKVIRCASWLACIGGVKVRREKALDFSGCKSRPGTGSLHPVAIEAAVEATKLSEPLMERVV